MTRIWLAALSYSDSLQIVGAYQSKWKATAIASIAERAGLDRERIECLALAEEFGSEWWRQQADYISVDGMIHGEGVVIETELVL